MSDLVHVLRAYRRWKEAGSRFAVLTVMSTSGSTYRRSGARMLVSEEGAMAGMISGGCLDSDLREHSVAVVRGGVARLVTYDAAAQNDPIWGVATGCGGTVDVLVESAATSDSFLRLLGDCVEKREPAAVVTSISGGVVRRLLLTEAGALGDLGLSSFKTTELARRCLRQRTAPLPGTDEDGPIFIEYVESRPSVVIFGAGDDAVPLVEFAATLGWDVTVCDRRPAFVDAVRFPAADRVVPLAAGALPSEIRFDERTAVVLMTHDIRRDLETLQLLSDVSVGYLGILGPRKRTERLIEESAGTSRALRTPLASRIDFPTGLDLGGDSPAETALSIVSAIQATFARRKGGFLRERKSGIHETEEQLDSALERRDAAAAGSVACSAAVPPGTGEDG